MGAYTCHCATTQLFRAHVVAFATYCCGRRALRELALHARKPTVMRGTALTVTVSKRSTART
jgi:hypothetical protein